MERLISMTDFVLITEGISEGSESRTIKNTCYDSIVNYANFLKQKLSLEQFVPCKLVEGVWEPIKGKENHFIRKELDEFREADKIVLFEGWKLMQIIGDSVVLFNDKSDIIEFINGTVWIFDEYKTDTIEGLSFYSEKENIPIELTPTAKKQIGL